MQKITIILALSLIVLVSCDEESFLKEEPKDAIYAENLYKSYSGFLSGMNAVYSMMREIKTDSELAGRDALWAINTDNVSTRDYDINSFVGMSPSWEELDVVYNWLYQVINSSNLIINRAEGEVDWEGAGPDEDLANKNEIISQAMVARYWAYRLLIYSFGPVPLSTEEITGGNYSNAWERNSIGEIKEHMREDLEFCVETLSIYTSDNTQINGAVARHYLGELYLSLGMFQEAVDVLKPLCEGNEYSLVQGRFGRVAGNSDGNLFMDVIRSPYTYQGNTETFFTFANGLDLPGSTDLKMLDSWVGHYRDFNKIERNVEWYERFGGFGKGRMVHTPWGMFDESTYNLYKKMENIKDPDNPHIIDLWLWNNTDGRDNFLYEMDDIRGQNTSLRRYFVYDWNGNGTLTDTSTYPLETTLYHTNMEYNDELNQGDSLYTLYLFLPDNLGHPDLADRYAYMYSRKWEVDNETTNNWADRNADYSSIGYLRLAESYLLYAEALYMNGNSGGAAIWLNQVRDRAGASQITAADVSIDFILDERSRELIGEEERRVSLLRTGKYLERVKKYNPLSMYYVEDHHKLYPFPSNAIDANKDRLLDQNVGWGGSTTVDYTPDGYPDEGINP